MKLSFSNLAWNFKDNDEICSILKTNGFSALEIAPTIIAPDPFTRNTNVIQSFSKSLKSQYHLEISSLQSIWFDQTGNIFNSNDSSELLTHTKKIIDLANNIRCKNIVFGCPRNRNIPDGCSKEQVIPFFKALGDYAKTKNTCIALEANPTIYNTNFINTTTEAFNFAKVVNSDGLKVNVDLGTIIYNNENLQPLADHAELINHIHISEPNLTPITPCPLHQELANLLKSINYNKYLSVEMKNPENLDIIKSVITYISQTFAQLTNHEPSS